MGNRGTTPSWDDEQIAKYGFFEHMRMVAAPFMARDRERRAALVQEYIDDSLALLGSSTEEDKARVSVAIPDVIPTLILRIANDTLLPEWRRAIASDVYRDWYKRAHPNFSPLVNFDDLAEEEKKPFYDVVEAIAQVWETRNQTSP